MDDKVTGPRSFCSCSPGDTAGELPISWETSGYTGASLTPIYTPIHTCSLCTFSHEHIEDKIEDTAKWTYLSVAFTVAYSYPDKMSDWNNTAITPLFCTTYQTENELSLDFKLKYGPLNLQSWKLLCNALLKFCKIS